MTLFEVWVPEKTVKLRLDGTDRDMERGDDGWWHLPDNNRDLVPLLFSLKATKPGPAGPC